MKNKTLSENLSELNDVLKSYLAARLKLWKVLLLEKIMRAGTYFFSTIGVLISAFSCLLFLEFAFSYWYGDTQGSITTGLLISAGFNLLLMVLIYLLRKRLFSRHILKNIRDILFDEDEINKAE